MSHATDEPTQATPSPPVGASSAIALRALLVLAVLFAAAGTVWGFILPQPRPAMLHPVALPPTPPPVIPSPSTVKHPPPVLNKPVKPAMKPAAETPKIAAPIAPKPGAAQPLRRPTR